jgi:hypothetical protein
MITAWILAVTALSAGSRARTPCPMVLEDDEGQECLQIGGAWPLSRFASTQPSVVGARVGVAKAPRTELSWRPLASPAKLDALGSVEGRRVYGVSYSPSEYLVISDHGGGAFDPLLFIELGDNLASFDRPSVFRWNGRELLSVRLRFSGMGALQETLFFGLVEGRFAYLRTDVDALLAFAKAHNITIHHRGGGFGDDTLIWENWAWAGNEPPDGLYDTLRAVYRIEGSRLTLESASLVGRAGPHEGCPGVLAHQE